MLASAGNVSRCVFLVSVNNDLRSVIEEALSIHNAEVCQYGSGLDAIASIESKVPDLIIFDNRALSIDGLHFARVLRSNPDPGVQHTPLLITDANASSAYNRAPLDEFTFISPHPIDQEYLRKYASAIFAGTRYEDPMQFIIFEPIRSPENTLAELIMHSGNKTKVVAYGTPIEMQDGDVAVLHDPVSIESIQALLSTLRNTSPNCVIVAVPHLAEPSSELLWMERGVDAFFDESVDASGFVQECRQLMQQRQLTLAIKKVGTNSVTGPRSEDAERLSMVAEAVTIGTFYCEFGNHVFHYSPEVVKLIGCKPDEMALRKSGSILDIVLPEDRSGLELALDVCMHSEEGVTIQEEFRIRRPDGDPRWLMMRAKSMRVTEDDRAMPSYIVGILMDVTAKKHVEISLRESEERLRLLNENSDDMIFMQHLDGRYVYINSSKRSGVDERSMIGKSPYDVHDVETADYIMQRIEAVAATGKSLDTELQLEWQGDAMWFNDIVSPIRDEKNQITAVVTVSRNITERKMAEIALRANELKFRTLAENMNDVVWVADVESMTFLYVSPSVKRLRGFSSEEVMSMPVGAALTLESRIRLEKLLHERIIQFNSGELPEDYAETIEIEQPRKDGSTVWTELVTSMYRNMETGHIEVRGVTRDISERKKLNTVSLFLLKTGPSDTNQNFFADLAKFLSETTEMDCVSIDLVNNASLYAETIAVYKEGQAVDNYSYPLYDTPGGDIVANGLSIVECGVQDLYPCDPDLKDLNAQCLVGTSLKNGEGETIGIIRLISKRARADLMMIVSILQLVAIKASGELERRQVNRTLSQSEAKFSKAFHTNPDSININRLSDGVYIAINEGFTRTTGYTEDDVIGKSSLPGELGVWVNREDRKVMINELRTHGRVLEMEALFRRKDGSVLTGLLSSSIMEIDNQQCVISITRDITRRKRVAEELSAEKERLRVTLNSIADAVIATDVFGSITTFNPVAEAITGWECKEAIGQALEMVVTLQDTRNGAANMDILDRICTWGENIEQTEHVILVDKAGGERTIVYKGTPIRDESGTIVGAVLVLRDVTEEVRMRQDIQRMAKLDSLGIMAGGIAHDFNNLLTAISGNVGLASLALEGGDPGKMVRHLNDAEHAAIRAQDLTKQLLTFARGGEPVRDIVDFATLVREAVSLALTGSKCRCRMEMPNDMWPAYADFGQMSQVVHNLLINADQAMPTGGEILLTIMQVNIMPESSIPLEPGPYLRIDVSDTGIGIPREIQDKIFDPFFTTKVQGNGLGLASVYSIVKGHHGHVAVDSLPGIGTKFTFYVPALPEATVKTLKSHTEVKITNSWRILVMDDEEAIGELLKHILDSAGHQVTTVANGEDAVAEWTSALATGIKFDLAILDLTIPGGLGGKETMAKLLQCDPSARAIASSGYATDAIMANYRDYGFAGILAKPYRLKDVVSMITELQNNIGL